MKQFLLMLLFALVATFSFGQTLSTNEKTITKEPQKAPCEATELSYAVQIASTADPNLFVMQPAFKDVIDLFETEKVCTSDGKVVYRILIPVEHLGEAYAVEGYYRTTAYKDAFVVTYKNNKRIN